MRVLGFCWVFSCLWWLVLSVFMCVLCDMLMSWLLVLMIMVMVFLFRFSFDSSVLIWFSGRLVVVMFLGLLILLLMCLVCVMMRFWVLKFI